MSAHLTQSIFINLPITTAFERTCQLISSADGLQAFNHYFTTNKIAKIKQNSFQRQIALRIVEKDQKGEIHPGQSLRLVQEVIKNQKQRKITYKNIHQKQKSEQVEGEFSHRFEQNCKGQVYLILESSAKKGANCFPEKSEAQIQLLKIKDLIENQNYLKTRKNKGIFQKCC